MKSKATTAAKTFLLSCATFLSLTATLPACTSFMVKAQDGTVISARTMEFGVDMKYSLAAIPRGMEFTSPAPNNEKGLEWKTKYGYLGVAILGDTKLISDGMNEAGLSASLLWYENDTKWPELKPSEYKHALGSAFFISWVLGNHSTVAEVKTALEKVKLYGFYIPQMRMSPPMHYHIQDATGASLVVESDNGELHVYDNPYGVLTNAPNYPWMATNLRNYIGMSDTVQAPRMFAGIKLVSTGHGSGMLGLPGDITPPSRFVKMVVVGNMAAPAKDATGALNLAAHMANMIEIVPGIAVDRNEKGDIIANESTQWTVFRDLTNRILYFHTFNNLDIQKIDLKKINFSDGKIKTGLMTQEQVITDVTDTLK